jgi:glycine cleavage system regulatory protein
VLVYYEWTNRTDIAQKITHMFAENDIKSVVLTSSVTASEREEWIDKQLDKGIDVLICNPKLVETGLDLLSFTTIIFYQVGYNIFTMRQASRRSWRLSQTKDIKVYFLYYEGTIQAQALSLMATKLQASMAIEGKFSEEGLRAMSNNEDLLTQIANSVVEGIKDTVQVQTFVSVDSKDREHDTSRTRTPLKHLLVQLPKTYSLPYLQRPQAINKKKLTSNSKGLSNLLSFNSLINEFKVS